MEKNIDTPRTFFCSSVWMAKVTDISHFVLTFNPVRETRAIKYVNLRTEYEVCPLAGISSLRDPHSEYERYPTNQ